eukprot:4136458-Pyramimonas_sp.AAC.1
MSTANEHPLMEEKCRNLESQIDQLQQAQNAAEARYCSDHSIATPASSPRSSRRTAGGQSQEPHQHDACKLILL